MRLCSNRSQMTSKCTKNKKVARERVTDVLTTFWRYLWSITEQTQNNMNLFVLHNKEKKKKLPYFID